MFSINLSPVRARNAAAYVDVASIDLRAVDRAFNLNVARRLDFEALLHVAFNLNRAIKFNVARLNSDAAFNL